MIEPVHPVGAIGARSSRVRRARFVQPRTMPVFCRHVFLAVMLAASLVWPPGSVSAAEGPAIAVLDVERVLRGSKAGKALQVQISEIVSANRAKDQEAEEVLRAADQKLSQQRAVLSDEVYAQKRKELQSQFTREREKFQARRQRIQMAVDQAWSRIRDALIGVTKDVATERNIDIVVSGAGTVLSAKKLDITKDVLARLDDKLSEVPLTIEAQ